MNVLDFRRIVGKPVPVSIRISKESVQTRPETSLVNTGLSYELLHDYDFLKSDTVTTPLITNGAIVVLLFTIWLAEGGCCLIEKAPSDVRTKKIGETGGKNC